MRQAILTENPFWGELLFDVLINLRRVRHDKWRLCKKEVRKLGHNLGGPRSRIRQSAADLFGLLRRSGLIGERDTQFFSPSIADPRPTAVWFKK
jgi:hypothetical protein